MGPAVIEGVDRLLKRLGAGVDVTDDDDLLVGQRLDLGDRRDLGDLLLDVDGTGGTVDDLRDQRADRLLGALRVDVPQHLLVDTLGAASRVAIQQRVDIQVPLAVDDVGLVAVGVSELGHLGLIAGAHHRRVEEHGGACGQTRRQGLLGSGHSLVADLGGQTDRLAERAVIVGTGEGGGEQRAEEVVAQGQVRDAQLVDEGGLAGGGCSVEQEESAHGRCPFVGVICAQGI